MQTYTIKEISEIFDIPSSTLRYYEKEGIIPFVKRNDSGHRVYSEIHVGMLKTINCLKDTGMPIKDIQQFAEWVKLGDFSLDKRHQLFLERKKVVQQQMLELEENLKIIEEKCEYYESALNAGTESIHFKQEYAEYFKDALEK